jgi:hypothetical protein
MEESDDEEEEDEEEEEEDEDDESESASEMDEDEYETRIIIVRRRRDAQQATPEIDAAKKIQAAFRGYACRRLLSIAMIMAALRS